MPMGVNHKFFPCSPKSPITHKFSCSVCVLDSFLDLFPCSHVYHLSHFSFTFFDCYTERMYITLEYLRFMYLNMCGLVMCITFYHLSFTFDSFHFQCDTEMVGAFQFGAEI